MGKLPDYIWQPGYGKYPDNAAVFLLEVRQAGIYIERKKYIIDRKWRGEMRCEEVFGFFSELCYSGRPIYWGGASTGKYNTGEGTVRVLVNKASATIHCGRYKRGSFDKCCHNWK